jgi:8-oxo-dGTP diphosphatase
MAVKDGVKIFIKHKDTGEYLFFLRDNKPNIPNPNKWDLLGGGMEPGETPEKAAAREVEEETNISIDEFKFILERKVRHTVGDKVYNITSYIFQAVTDAPIEKIKLFEGRRIGYYTLADMKKMDVAPTILDLIIKLEDKLS